jgi:regulator of RNase E activity RraA
MPTRIAPFDGSLVPPALVERWRDVPVTIACDVGASARLVDPRIRPLRAPSPGWRLATTARTAWCERGDFGPVLHLIDRAAPGEILLIACDGRLDTAISGEILAEVARRKGIAGMIVDGALRDRDTLAALADFPAWCLGTTARGPLSRERGTVDAPIVLGGVAAAPGDLVLLDDDGVVILAPDQAASLIEDAEARVRAEQAWQAALASGRRLTEVFTTPEPI